LESLKKKLEAQQEKQRLALDKVLQCCSFWSAIVAAAAAADCVLVRIILKFGRCPGCGRVAISEGRLLMTHSLHLLCHGLCWMGGSWWCFEVAHQPRMQHWNVVFSTENN
jgi:hypothetical protein